MIPKHFWEAHPVSYVEQVCEDAGTNIAYFQQATKGQSSIGKHLAARLAKASGGQMTEMEILYPERFDDSPFFEVRPKAKPKAKQPARAKKTA